MDIHQYYHDPKIWEQLGRVFANCDWFLLSGRDYAQDRPPVRVHRISRLGDELGNGPDIFMPIILRNGVLGVFDLEYSHSDKMALFSPEEIDGVPFHDFVFIKYLEPIISSLEAAFGDECMTDTTWSGYHILTQIERDSAVYRRLLELGKGRDAFGIPKCLEHKLVHFCCTPEPWDPKREKPPSVEDLVVYEMFGRVLEFLSHELMAAEYFDKPIVICDSAEDCISLDLSQYADPAIMRIIRTPFSSWDKHNMHEPQKSQVPENFPFLDVIRKSGKIINTNLQEIFRLAKDYEAAIRYAHYVDGSIPTAGPRVLEVVDKYAASQLYRIHHDFDEQRRDSTPDKYRLMERNQDLPDEFHEMLVHPYPELLKPRNLKRFSEHLLREGWHPKHIGGLFAAFYTHPGKGWGSFWHKYTPEAKANFWARVYTSLVLNNS